MRIRKGSRVEVFSNKEAPYGAWRCAEIVSGNGHTYNVRFYSFQIEHEEAVMEKVPRKIIRPCPPLVDVERWDTGELVEVLDNFSWKAATVREELSGHYYVVRLLGTPEELTFHKVNLRARKSWQDERWVAIGKISGSLKSSTLTGSDVHQKLQPHRNSMPLHEPSVVSARLLKRPSPYNWSECAESCTGNPKKMRSLEKEGQQQKVDAISCRPENRGGKSHVQASLNNHKTGYCQIVRMALLNRQTHVAAMLNLLVAWGKNQGGNIHQLVMEQEILVDDEHLMEEQCCLIRACRPFASRGLTLMLGFTPSPLTI